MEIMKGGEYCSTSPPGSAGHTRLPTGMFAAPSGFFGQAGGKTLGNSFPTSQRGSAQPKRHATQCQCHTMPCREESGATRRPPSGTGAPSPGTDRALVTQKVVPSVPKGRAGHKAGG